MHTSIKFEIKTWKISELIKSERSGHLDLKPYYQRNAIWSAAAQKALIATIKSGYPLPNIFIRDLGEGRFEIIDGQQRCRAILSYSRGDLADEEKVILCKGGAAIGKIAEAAWSEAFLHYPLLVAVMDKSLTDKEVEQFYVTLNSTGIKLNAAELRKAEYYDTHFLSLASKLAGSDAFQCLELFTEKSSDRMNDVDFVSELLTFLLHGYTDKKLKLVDTYETDITEEVASRLCGEANSVLAKICSLNDNVPIKLTRFKQKNDFYTLFAFTREHSDLSAAALNYAYETVLALSPHISPSQENCEPLREYALNCVSQSNSKKAREARRDFFNEIFDNQSEMPTRAQKAIIDYLKLNSEEALVKQWGRLLINKELVN